MNDRATARRRARAPGAALPLLGSASERLPVGFALFDRGWLLVTSNARFAALRGYPRKLLKTGTPLESFVRFDAERGEYGAGDVDTLTRGRLAALKRGRPACREHALSDGRILQIACERLPEGGLLLTCEDVSGARRTAQRLRESEERYDFAMQAINEGVYDWDIAKGTIYYSKRVRNALGISPEEVRTPAAFLERLHPDDRPRFRAATVAHFKGETERFECDYRFRARDGGWRWARQHGVALRDARGRAYRMIGSTGDVTELKERERQVAEQSAEQAAVRELLEAMSRSAFDLDAVLRALVESATRLCGAEKGFIFRLDGDVYRLAVDYGGVTPEFREFEAQHPMRPGRETLIGRTALEKRTVHIEDVLADREYRFPESQRIGGFRTILGVPIVRDDVVIGVLALWKERVEPFTPTQIQLVTTFSSQAAIAIENARLFGETKEALEQQTATAEILRVIARSPTDIQQVLDAVASGAARLCDADDALIRRVEGDVLRLIARYGSIPIPAPREGTPINRGSVAGRSVVDRKTIHVHDLASADEADFPVGRAYARQVGYRTSLSTPLLREGRAIGTIGIRRRVVRPFTDQQIKLLEIFADQAAIAIENVRLFNETKEALEQQTATSEILGVIASSPTDLQPVLDTVVRNAARLCEASDASLFQVEGDRMRRVAGYGSVPVSLKVGESRLIGRGSTSGRSILDRQTLHVHDYHQLELASEYPDVKDAVVSQGIRTCLATPLMREGVPIGALAIYRTEVRPFAAKQIELVKTFADQAVIAIENVRLFHELQARNRDLSEALEQQTATAEILRVISSSPTDVQPVFDAIATSGVHLFQGMSVSLRLAKGDRLERVAFAAGPGCEVIEDSLKLPLPLNDRTFAGRAVSRGEVVHAADVFAEDWVGEESRKLAEREGWRACAAAPLLRENKALGAIIVSRAEPRPFSTKEVALLRTFADQAVIAIENVRLFNELQARNRELTESLEQQTATAEILKVISSSPTDVQPVLDAVAENALRVCEAEDALVLVPDGPVLRIASHRGSIPRPSGVEAFPIRRGLVVARAMLDRRTIHVGDMQAESEAEYPDSVRYAKEVGFRTMLAAPLLREGAALGAILIRRENVLPFSERQIRLLETFADQAVIAVENVRLFNETKEALDHQKASAEVLQVISSSVADTKPVFDKILESSERLFEGLNVGICLVGEDGAIHLSAYHDPNREELIRHFPLPLNEASGNGAAILQRRVIHYPDREAADVPEYVRRGGRIAGNQAILFAPMLWEGRGIGSIFVGRATVGEFSEKEIALLKTFADQAVIAIQNARLFNETKEALEQQTATADILKVISSSPTDIRPVLEAVAGTAARLCDASDATILRLDGDVLRLAAHEGSIPTPAADDPLPVNRDTVNGRAVVDRQTIHVHDLAAADEGDYPLGRTYAKRLGFRTALATPLLREGQPVGTIHIRRLEVRPFSDKQIKLLETFADQAAIAIENVRLFNETKEALERQTATSEVLKVISRSTFDLQPVLETLIENAARLCGARNGAVFRFDGKLQRLAAAYNISPEFKEFVEKNPLSPGQGTAAGRAVLEGRTVHIPDVVADPDYDYPASYTVGDIRSILSVPMLKEGTPIGVMSLWRSEVRPFTDKQIDLLTTFADQAAIAIQNVRLLQELQARNRELTESLEQQTATGEILRVISSSPTDLAPVFDAVAKSVSRLCDAPDVVIVRAEGGAMRFAAGVGPFGQTFGPDLTVPIRRGSVAGRAVLERRTIQVDDLAAESEDEYPEGKAIQRRYGHRTMVVAPLLLGDTALGSIGMLRKEVRPFSDKQLALLRTFADQAVIAIENVRLFNETKEALDQQKASAEVLQVISSSVADTRPVFEKILESCERLFGARNVGISLVGEDGAVHLAAFHGPGGEAYEQHFPVPFSEESGTGAAILQRRVVHYPDVDGGLDVPEYARRGARIRGNKSLIVAPMLWEGRGVGAILVGRATVGEFSEKEIALLKTFADQAVIAIQNARLFNETKEALERQTATAEILRVISASPTDVQPVFDAIVRAAVRLCDGRLSTVLRFDGDFLDLAAHHNLPAEGLEAYRRVYPRRVDRGTVAGCAILDRAVINVADSRDETTVPPHSRAMAAAAGFRGILAVPMLREGEPIGILNVGRAEPGQFSQAHVDLLKTFADQAVIAIENVRLFNETKEALDQLKASAEVLQVISSSVADTKPVFETILESCERLFEGRFAGVGLVGHDGTVHLGAYHGPGREALEKHFPVPLNEESGSGVAILQRRVIHYPDVEGGADVPEYMRRGARISGYKSVILAPMLWEGRGIGVIFVGRDVVGEFSEKEITLLKTFADQAVIAIQNARLFNETKEALERQTATAEILKVISASPTDVQPVFDAIVSHAGRLAGGCSVNVSRVVGDHLHLAAYTRVSPEADEALKSFYPIGMDEVRSTIAEAVRSRAAILVSDHETDPRVSPNAKAVMRARGFRSTLYVPIVRGDVVYGVMHVSRIEPGPFPEQWVSLLKTFADQAVIAIENVRLFNETKEALDQQTATADILKVMSASPTDVQPVFDAIATSGVRLFQGVAVSLRVVKGDRIERVAFAAAPGCEVSVDSTNAALPLDDRSFAGRAVLHRKLIHVPDIPAADWVGETSRTANERMGARAIAAAPMLRENKVLGVIAVTRARGGPFSDKELALLTTFAAQAVIAIENVRLFNETKEALDHQRASAEVLQVISSSVADATPVFDKILESCQRLFVGQHVGITLIGEDGAVHLGPYRGPRRPELEQLFPVPLSRESATGAAILERRVMHYPDTENGADVPEPVRRDVAVMGFKSSIFAPMLWEGRGIGAIWVNREFAGSFSDKEISLLKTFADQAVIAIQNAKLFREIQEKSHQLEIANQHKSAFLANMSHELRTPLNAVIGFSEMLAARYFGDLSAKQAEYVSDIHGSGKHLLSLINDILDLSKIEAGRMELETAEFDLRAALDNALTLVRERAQRSGVALRLQTDPELRAIEGDERKVKQVVLNLLSNAVKFTPRGGAVSLTAKRANGAAEIAVTDTGVGIAPADQETIFEAFRQVGTDVTRKREGTGLGLALSRRFVELHGGTIRVESAPGKGSTFTVTLPLRHGE